MSLFIKHEADMKKPPINLWPDLSYQEDHHAPGQPDTRVPQRETRSRQM